MSEKQKVTAGNLFDLVKRIMHHTANVVDDSLG